MPTVLPVVLYTGKEAWSAVVALAPQWPPELEALQDYGQRPRFVLVTAGTAAQARGERTNLADGMFRIERAECREQRAVALNWMREALAEAGNPAVDDAVSEWLTEVQMPSRARDTDVERLPRWREAPGTLELYPESWTDAPWASGEARGEGQGTSLEASCQALRVRHGRRDRTIAGGRPFAADPGRDWL